MDKITVNENLILKISEMVIFVSNYYIHIHINVEDISIEIHAIIGLFSGKRYIRRVITES